ncbi:MAG: DUF4124 domain-containing protein [Xanthomonadales bacterium]|nr:DUF4124 domain-containing protein [Xanthomonadales bacterium]
MFKGLNIAKAIAIALVVVSGTLAAQVYKVVDENGNVTYTDQPPGDGTAPMDLPEITVIDTDYADQAAAAQEGETQAAEEEQGPTPRELRRTFRDFRLISPAPEQTYWGTANTVVVSWGASAPYEDGMSVTVVVNGESQDVGASENLAVTLDRGAHQAYAVLRDARGRRIVTTDTVTFHVKQASALNNPG